MARNISGSSDGFSRRALVQALSTSPVFSSSKTPLVVGDASTISAAWLATAQEVNRLSDRWRAIEARMMRDPKWPSLSHEEKQAPYAEAEMAKIDKQRDALEERQLSYLTVLATLPAKDVSAVISKLAVVVGEMYPRDNAPVYKLILDSANELAALRCPHCGEPLAQPEAASKIDAAKAIWD